MHTKDCKMVKTLYLIIGWTDGESNSSYSVTHTDFSKAVKLYAQWMDNFAYYKVEFYAIDLENSTIVKNGEDRK